VLTYAKQLKMATDNNIDTLIFMNNKRNVIGRQHCGDVVPHVNLPHLAVLIEHDSISAACRAVPHGAVRSVNAPIEIHVFDYCVAVRYRTLPYGTVRQRAVPSAV
jgi:hypothetical protein